MLAGNLSDCEALTAFASQTAMSLSASGITNVTSYFIQEFGVFVPSDHLAVRAANAVGIPIASVSTGTNPFQPIETSGFQGQYQDRDGPGLDQVHHFAAYFQFGYFVGSGSATLASVVSDIANPGDIVLAQKAADIGARLRSGELSIHGVGSEISGLCNKR
jgi:hypothetical protein